LFHFSVFALACGFCFFFPNGKDGGRGKDGPSNKALKQDWVDNMFGPGTSQRFIQIMGTMDWRNCFTDIYQQIITLPPSDQLFLKQSAHSLFQGLMESDGLKDVEQDRLEDLMRYIRQSLEKVT